MIRPLPLPTADRALLAAPASASAASAAPARPAAAAGVNRIVPARN